MSSGVVLSGDDASVSFPFPLAGRAGIVQSWVGCFRPAAGDCVNRHLGDGEPEKTQHSCQNQDLNVDRIKKTHRRNSKERRWEKRKKKTHEQHGDT